MNRRYQELEKQKTIYTERLNEAQSISECLIYQGKLEAIEKEQTEIQKRYKE